MEVGFVYAPYIPLQSTQITLEQDPHEIFKMANLEVTEEDVD